MLGTHFINKLKDWRRIQWLNDAQLQELENENLRKLLFYAVNNVKYYQSLNIDIDPLNPIACLKSFPILYKHNIKGNEKNFLFGNREDLIVEKSSGSSGIQGMVYLSKKEASATQAMQTLLWEWSGYRFGEPLLQLGMTTKRSLVKRVKDFLLRTDYQQAFNINGSEINQALNRTKSGISYFGGYASGLYTYSMLAENPPKFRSVISWGDKMFDHYRKSIESAFGCKVYDTYGCTEGLVIAGQCSEGNYHVLSPHVKLELLDAKGQEVDVGEPGFVVVTRLDGFSMPLIRYYLGDLAIREDPTKKCKCGRSLPLIRKIIGRDTDIVKTKSGKMLIVHFFTAILEHFPCIKQFRIVQENLEGFRLEYIPEEQLFENGVLDEIRRTMTQKIEEPIFIDFVKVDAILPTSSGKPQIIKSLLKT